MMRRVTQVLACGALLALAWSALAADQPLPSDPRIQRTTLPNGVTWLYRKHDNPPGKMFVLIHVRSGSLNETDAQRGLAHFTEHMAFNGSENFAPGKLVPYFESIGMQFGDDLNAFTGFDQTVFLLYLPDNKPEQVDKALMVLSDYAFRLSLLPEEIDKERGVILEELRAGKGPKQRLQDQLMVRLFDGTRVGERLPIGKEEVIKGAAKAAFDEYYRTWFRPENVTLVMVGDADPEPYRALVEKWFGQYKPEAPAQEPGKPNLKPFTQARAIVLSDPEYADGDIVIADIRPARPPVTTTAAWRTRLVERLATWIVDRRLAERLKKGQATYQQAEVSVEDFLADGVLATASATGKPEDWEKMLGEVVVEVRRAVEFGFRPRELDLAKSEIKSQADRRVRTEPTVNARGLLFGIASSVNEREPVLSAQQELDLVTELLPTVTLEEVTRAFTAHFKSDTFAYVLQMPKKDDVKLPTEAAVLAAAQAASAQKLEPPGEDSTATDFLSAEPTPGAASELTTDKDLNITSAYLANGVRVHHRFMDYKKDTVLVSITLCGGQLEEDPNNAGITGVATLAISQAATQHLSSTVITDLLTGKNISVECNARDDTFAVEVQGSPRDLEAGLRLVHALLTEPKIEDSAFQTWRQQSLQQLEMAASDPQFHAIDALMDLTSGGDPRRTMATPERVKRQELAAAQAWLIRLCREAPIEVAVVGDAPWETVRPLLEKYLGSLPQRPRDAAKLMPLRKLNRGAGPFERRLKVETITDKAVAIFGFIGCDVQHVDDARMLELASKMLDSRLVKRVREDLGLVYSIGVQNAVARAYTDGGVFLTGAPCDPQHADEVVKAAAAIFTDFAEKGPTPTELDNARKQMDNELDTQMKEPGFWLGILAQLDLHQLDLARVKTLRADVQGYTAEQIRDVFNKYYTPQRTFRVISLPHAPATQPTTGPAGQTPTSPAPAGAP